MIFQLRDMVQEKQKLCIGVAIKRHEEKGKVIIGYKSSYEPQVKIKWKKEGREESFTTSVNSRNYNVLCTFGLYFYTELVDKDIYLMLFALHINSSDLDDR